MSIHLPLEMIEAILLLLPPKSVGQFKSVSKTWNSLISDPQFIKTHLHQNHQITPKLIMVAHATSSLYSVDTNELFQSEDTDEIPATGKEVSFNTHPVRWNKMLGSCNGLVLVRDGDHTLFLVNPTTREVWILPPSPFKLLDFDVEYGLGYDSIIEDYKVASITMIMNTDDRVNVYVSVYSLRNNSLSCFRSICNHTEFNDPSCPLINQSFHWLAITHPGDSMIVAVFSLESEEFDEIKLPDSIANDESLDCVRLIDAGGKLGVLVGEDYVDLWVMEEYGVCDSWTKVFIHGVELDVGKALCLAEGTSRIVVFDYGCEAVVYNIDERRCRTVRIVGGPSDYNVGGAYVETLESPKRIVTSP